jgi:predicted kinase
MLKPKLSQPTFIMLYGLPGAGKSTLARQLADMLNVAHVHSDRIRFELFDKPAYTKSEESVVARMMDIQSEAHLKLGTSVIYDINAARLQDRRRLREFAQQHHAKPLLVWLQIDAETALQRVKSRDRRKLDDKYSHPLDESTFQQLSKLMQNPYLNEDHLVISGKHLFANQKHAILRKLIDANLLADEDLRPKIPKPELVNLVSRARAQAGRVDLSRRNISIR